MPDNKEPTDRIIPVSGITLIAGLIAAFAILTCIVWAASVSSDGSNIPSGISTVNSTNTADAGQTILAYTDRPHAHISIPGPTVTPAAVPPTPPSVPAAPPKKPVHSTPPPVPTRMPTSTPMPTPKPVNTTTAVGQVALDGMTGPGLSITIGSKFANCDQSGFFRISGLPVNVPLALTARSGPQVYQKTVTLADVPVNNLGQINIPLDPTPTPSRSASPHMPPQIPTVPPVTPGN